MISGPDLVIPCLRAARASQSSFFLHLRRHPVASLAPEPPRLVKGVPNVAVSIYLTIYGFDLDDLVIWLIKWMAQRG